MSDRPQIKFETEMRAGVPHFKPGQRKAIRDAEEPDAALLMSVNQFGHCIALACWRERGTEYCKGEWHVDPAESFTLFASGLTRQGVQLPPCFELSAESVEALDNAEVVEGEEAG